MIDLKDNEENIIALAGLLHDVGKLLNRCDGYMKNKVMKTKKHPQLSVEFLKDLNEKGILMNNNILKEVVQRHHEAYYIDDLYKVQNIKDTYIKNLAYIVSRADSYSSMERREKNSQNKTYFKSRPLDSLFNELEIDKNYLKKPVARYKLNELDYNNIFPMNFNNNKQEEILKLVDKLYNELDRLECDNFHSFFITILNILEKYTWCIPSDTQKKVCDISLFDHLKTTSALALSLYMYHKDTNTLNQNNITNDKENKFLLICGEFNGLEEFSQNINTTKKSAKRLRGRAFLGSLIIESFMYKILKDLKLTIANNILNKGNKFYILAPNIETIKEKLNKIQKEINTYFYNKFEGEIYFNLGEVDTNGNELKNFTVLLNKIENKLNKNKNNNFNEFILENPIVSEQNNISGVCPICNKYLVSNDVGECALCKMDTNIGKWLTKTKFIAFYEGNVNVDRKIELFNKNISIVFLENEQEIDKIDKKPYIINNLQSTELLNKYPSGFKFYANYVPTYASLQEYKRFNKSSYNNIDYQNEIKDFEAIAAKGEGVKNLGVLDIEIDNLDMLMDIGLLGSNKVPELLLYNNEKDNIFDYTSISRIATLNRMINLFKDNFIFNIFNNVKKEIMKLKFQKVEINLNNHYILNPNGNEIIIIGPWNEVIFTAKYIKDKFEEFISYNTDITLSAGIGLVKYTEPVTFGIKKAKKGLKKVRKHGNDGIVVFDRFIKWNNFDDVFDFGEYIYKKLKDRTYSQSFIYRLLKYTQMIEEYVNLKGQDVYKLQYMSKFNYDIHRNLVPKIAEKLGIKNYKNKKALDIILQQEDIKKLTDLFCKEDSVPKENDFVYKYMKIALNYAVRKNRGGDLNDV